MDVQLVMFKENGESKRFPLELGKTVIGRREECDLRIPLPEISRQHAMLIVTEKSVTVRDLGSSNGTYLNNKRITEEELAAGDHIVIGPVVFTIQINGEPANPKPVHTRLEARSTREVGARAEAKVTQAGRDEAFGDEEEDPISALEALANSDDTAALNLDDSFGDSENP